MASGKVISLAHARKRRAANAPKTIALTVITHEDIELGEVEGDEPLALIFRGDGVCMSLATAQSLRNGLDAAILMIDKPKGA